MAKLNQILIILFFSVPVHGQESNKIEIDMENIKPEIRKQTQEIKKQEVEPTGRIERVEVTGSHIKRIDVEGPSPLMTIDQEDLVRSGYNSVADVLRDTGVNSFGSFREHAGQLGSGTAAVDLRGLGQVRTLILLNGQRLPADAISGAVDLNIIPMAAVERIDILKDGASAIYGSDALGGVVNIITKKNFEGNEFGSSFSVTEQPGGERRDLSHTYGYNTNNFRMTNVVFYRHNERVMAADREWSKFGLSSYGSPGSFSKDNGKSWEPDPNCPPEQVLDNGRCGYNFGAENWELPTVQQSSLMNEMAYDISEDLTAFSRVGLSYKQTDWVLAPAFTDNLSMDDPNNPGDRITNIRYRFNELGNRSSNTQTVAGTALMGMKGYFSDTWDWTGSLSFNKIDRKERRSGYALTGDIQNAIDNGDFNPLAPAGDRGDLTGLGYDPQQNSISENTFFEWKANGEVGDLGAGPVNLAFGTQASRELYRDWADDRTLAGDVLAIASSAGGGVRNSASVFSEASFQFLEDLETVSALRFDYFEGFGGTVNPKLGFRYLPMKELMFRASAGTGFKAPQMQRLYAARSAGFSRFIDEVYCEKTGGAACTAGQYRVAQSGNDELQEERAFSFNVGTVVQPNKRHSVGIDFWYYDLRDLVQDTDYGALTRAEASGVDLSQFGVSVQRDPTTGEIVGDGIFAPFLNISSTEVQGLDFNYDGKVPTNIGDFRLVFQHSHMIYFKTEGFPGTGITDMVGTFGRPQWRNNTTLFYIPDPNHEISVLGRTIGENLKTRASAGKHPTYTEYDVRYSWLIDSWDARLTFGIKNLLGSLPPFDDSVASDPDLNFRLYDERGRSAYLGYRQVF